MMIKMKSKHSLGAFSIIFFSLIIFSNLGKAIIPPNPIPDRIYPSSWGMWEGTYLDEGEEGTLDCKDGDVVSIESHWDIMHSEEIKLMVQFPDTSAVSLQLSLDNSLDKWGEFNEGCMFWPDYVSTKVWIYYTDDSFKIERIDLPDDSIALDTSKVVDKVFFWFQFVGYHQHVIADFDKVNLLC